MWVVSVCFSVCVLCLCCGSWVLGFGAWLWGLAVVLALGLAVVLTVGLAVVLTVGLAVGLAVVGILACLSGCCSGCWACCCAGCWPCCWPIYIYICFSSCLTTPEKMSGN